MCVVCDRLDVPLTSVKGILSQIGRVILHGLVVFNSDCVKCVLGGEIGGAGRG